MNSQEITKFEFLLTLGGNIVCQRYFNVRDYNPLAKHSMDLHSYVKEICNEIEYDLKIKSSNYLCENKNISEEFFEKHIDGVIWDNLCVNKNISEEFFERHIDKVKWYNLCENKNYIYIYYENILLQLILYLSHILNPPAEKCVVKLSYLLYITFLSQKTKLTKFLQLITIDRLNYP